MNDKENDKNRLFPSTILIFSLWVLVMLITIVVWRNYITPPPRELAAVLWPEPKTLTAIDMVDQDGNRFNLNSLKGKWSFVFFGYTSCPDICPTTLAVLAQVEKILRQDDEIRSDSQVIFITVDPNRDTIEKLANYIKFFSSEFIALTGNKASIDDIARQFNAGYIIEPADESGSYLVSHTSAIFLTADNANLVGAFSIPHNPANIAALYKEIRSLL